VNINISWGHRQTSQPVLSDVSRQWLKWSGWHRCTTFVGTQCWLHIQLLVTMELSDPEVGHVTTGCGVVLVGICCLSVIQPEPLCLVTSLQAIQKAIW